MLGATAYVTAFFTLVLAGMMLVPMLVDLSVGNPDWQAFLFSALAAGVPSGFMCLPPGAKCRHSALNSAFCSST